MNTDDGELERSYLSARPILLRYLARRGATGGDGEDLVQELWLRLSRNAPAALAAPLPYMMRAIRNLAIDQDRARGRRLRQGEVDALLDLPGEDPDPERRAMARSELRRLAQVLTGLSPRRRDILIAARLRREPYAAIAARHGVSVRTVEYEMRMALDHCLAGMARVKDEEPTGRKRP